LLQKLDSEFKFPTAMGATPNGKIEKIYYHKDEKKWVTAIKKSIISAFQTRLNVPKSGTDKIEKDSSGVHFSHYRYK
jgi:hypothetical protein